jgi:hypothetical protein
MRTIESIKENEVVHCPTEEEAIEFLKLAHEAGHMWASGHFYISTIRWEYAKTDTCYNIKRGGYASLQWYKENDYIITPVSEFLPIKYDFQIGDTFINSAGNKTTIIGVNRKYLRLESCKGTKWDADKKTLIERLNIKAYTDYTPVSKESHKLEIGEYYKVEVNSGFWMIGKIVDNTVKQYDDQYNCIATIITQANDLKKNVEWCYKYNDRSYKKATQEEREWLDACIKADKYVPRPKKQSISKIAIKGSRTRGEEVIKYLESLGAENYYKYCGNLFSSYYFINTNNKISRTTSKQLVKGYEIKTIDELVPLNKNMGELEGFPQEVIDKMLERQVEQGNSRDIQVFKHYKFAGKPNGGFDWHKTIEGSVFWNKVIADKKFDIFFDRYPKNNTFTTAKSVSVKCIHVDNSISRENEVIKKSSCDEHLNDSVSISTVKLISKKQTRKIKL